MIELQSRRISGDDGPRLLIIAGVHGDEFEPMLAVAQLIERLEQVELRGTVTLVPIVHRNAFERGTREGSDGLDLARTCPGRADGSVTEQTAHALSQLIHNTDYLLDLHTGGLRYHLLPLTGYMLHADAKVLDAQRRMARAFNLPIVWGTDPSLAGRSLSVARDAGVPAIYAEHGAGGVFHGPCVGDYIQGCLNVMHELDMLAVARPANRVQYVVEDQRPQAGHLQAGHPAPTAGIFEPAVEPGDRVETGDLLGTIVDPLASGPQAVKSLESGIVLMIRSFARVAPGDALATILDPELARRSDA